MTHPITPPPELVQQWIQQSTTTGTDWRALCEELVEKLHEHTCLYEGHESELVSRARAALAQPEPQGPTDEELCKTLHQAICDFPPTHPSARDLDAHQYEIALELHKARAVLARWGRPAIEPVPVAERLPVAGDCDAEGWCWWFDGFNWMLGRFEEWYTHWLPHHALPVPQQGE
jgi:hypothetical protein